MTLLSGEFGVLELTPGRGSLPIVSTRLARGTAAKTAARTIARLTRLAWVYRSKEKEAPARVEQETVRLLVSFGKGKRVQRTKVVKCLVRVLHRALAVHVTVAGPGGGTVTSSPGGVNCTRATTPCSNAFPTGTRVTLRATPSGDSNFAGWSGACTGSGTCTVRSDAVRRVTATFTRKQVALTVSKAGNGAGTVSGVGGGISCGAVCTGIYESGTVVTLTAAADAKSQFGGWSGACSGADVCTVRLAAAASVTATFVRITVPLTVTKTGTGGGTVSTSPGGISCGATCSGSFEVDTQVTLIAAPDATSFPPVWSGGCTGSGMTCSVTMSAARFVTASFALGALLRVEVNTDTDTGYKGVGKGAVTSDPPGINCDERGPAGAGNTCTALFPRSKRVTLLADPDEDNSFIMWFRCDPNRTSYFNPCLINFPELYTTPVVAHFGPG